MTGIKEVPSAKLHWSVELDVVDGMWIKQISIPKKDSLLPQHVHQWDHATLLAKGSVTLWRGDVPSLHAAPAMLHITAGISHTFQSMTDDVLLYCLHNLHSEDKVAVLKEHDIPFEDYGGFER